MTEQIKTIFAAVHEAAPREMRYLALREVDHSVFTLMLEIPDGGSNPLQSIPAAAVFRGSLAGQTDDDVTPRSCTVVGSYRA